MIRLHRFALTGTLLAFLSGCGIGYVVSTYGKTPVEKIDVNDSTYRVFHRADLHKVMVTPTIAQSMASGASFFAYDPTKGSGMQMAVEKYLNQAGYKDCTITRGKEVTTNQVEFSYQCATVPVQPAAVK